MLDFETFDLNEDIGGLKGSNSNTQKMWNPLCIRLACYFAFVWPVLPSEDRGNQSSSKVVLDLYVDLSIAANINNQDYP